MIRIAVLVLIAAAIALFVRNNVIEGVYAKTASMEPSLPQGKKVFLEKITLHFNALDRGDVVVFPSPIDRDKDLIKRVIAISGDTIEIRDKMVYLNGAELREPYVQHTRPDEILVGDNLGPLTVPEGMVFVMGDNRDVSGDSRDWKDPQIGDHIYFVAVRNIKGRIVRIF